MINKDKPLVFILFGITGDLSRKKIIPAVFELYKKGKLPKDFHLVGFSRREFARTDFEFFLKEILGKDEKVSSFIEKTSYVQGDFSDVESYKNLLRYLESLDQNFNKCFNKIFHLAIPPEIYEVVFKNIYLSGLSIICKDLKGESFSRLLVEKPFGSDYKSSLSLNNLALKLFEEKNIFRIDHYNAKDFVSKIRKTKFDYKKIKEVSIKILEKETVENRGAFYDKVGAISDVLQNHILQILSFVGLKEGQQKNEQKASFFNSLSPVKKTLKIGQYNGFLEHSVVREGSRTETYFKGQLEPKEGNLMGISIDLETGKAMAENKVEVNVSMKNGQSKIYTPSSETILPYEKVVSEAILGKKDIFVGREEVLASWKLVDRIKKILKNKELEIYEKNSKH